MTIRVPSHWKQMQNLQGPLTFLSAEGIGNEQHHSSHLQKWWCKEPLLWTLQRLHKDAWSVLGWSLRELHSCPHVQVNTPPLFQQQMRSWKFLWMSLSMIHPTQSLKWKKNRRHPDRGVTARALAEPRGAGTVCWGCCWRKERLK